MGFATLMDMLQSLRDLIELERLPNGEVKIHQKKLRGISGTVTFFLSFAELPGLLYAYLFDYRSL